jgi:NAD(P)-dependent dehydrogenase (short-subunit alcohol dehydrogenase family)
MTRSPAREVALGITVNAVCPGLVETPMFDGLPARARGDAGRVAQRTAHPERSPMPS